MNVEQIINGMADKIETLENKIALNGFNNKLLKDKIETLENINELMTKLLIKMIYKLPKFSIHYYSSTISSSVIISSKYAKNEPLQNSYCCTSN